MPGDGSQVPPIDEGESDCRQRHPQKIEEKGRSVLKRILNKDECGAPDEHDSQEQKMGDCGWAQALQRCSGHGEGTSVRTKF
jgi:hypothetical protein